MTGAETPTQRPPLRLLFVCVENAGRSQMAEAFARKHGGEGVEAWSAGSKPSGKVNPLAAQAMGEVGCDLSTHRSKSLADVPRQAWDAVVTMGCGDACPSVPARVREDWALPDPKGMGLEDVREVRDRIGEHVRSLLARLRG